MQGTIYLHDHRGNISGAEGFAGNRKALKARLAIYRNAGKSPRFERDLDELRQVANAQAMGEHRRAMIGR